MSGVVRAPVHGRSTLFHGQQHSPVSMADYDLPLPLGLRFWDPLVVGCNSTKTMAPTPI
jgi:hypothetical protein